MPDLPQQDGADPISTAEQIRNNLNFSLDASPDREAELRRLSVATGTPIESVRAHPDAVKQLAAQQSFDAVGVALHHPELGRFLIGLDNTRLIHDDIPATAAVESATRAVARAPVATRSAIDILMPGGQAQATQAAAPAPAPSGDWTSPITAAVKGLGGSWNKAAASLNMVLGGVPALYGSVTGDTRAQDWWFRNMVDPRLNQQKAFELDQGAGLGSKAAHTAGALLGMLSQITLGGTGGTPAALSPAAGVGETVGAAVEHGAKSMLLPALSDSINVGREVFKATGDGAAAARAATAQYVSTTAAGVIPLSVPGKLATRLGTGFVSGATMGEVSRQGMNLALPPEMQSGFDWENAFLSGVAGSVLSIAGPRAVPDGVFDAVRRTYTDAARAEEALKTGQAIQDLSEAATNAKLRERAPDDFKAFVKNIAGEGELQNVWVDGKTLVEGLQQSGLSIDQLREQLPDVASQINESLHTDGLVRIPVEDYATHIAGSQLDGALLQSLRSTPDGMTIAEAKDFQAKQAEAMQAEVKAVSAEAEAGAQKIESQNAIRDSVKAQLDATKRFRPDVTSRYADLTAAYYVTQAERMGISPEELLAQHPLKVQAESLLGPQFGQGGTLADLKQQWAAAGIKGDIAENGDVITLSRIIVPEGERGTGKGTAAMQALVDYADRTGRHVALSPSSDFGGNKKRLVQFYKRFGFVENKGKNRAFTTSESMYRQAAGKVLYQNGEQVGPFGPVLTEFKGDAQGAIAKLMEMKSGEAIGALHHPDIGDIDLVWGEEGANAHDGYGLSKLVRWHPDVLGDLQGIVSSMKVVKRSENRAMLESADHKGGVRLQWDGVRKTWLLTAFRKDGAKGGGVPRTDTNTETQVDGSLPAHPSDDSVAQRIDKFYQEGNGPHGAYDPASNTITLGKEADLSTFLQAGLSTFLHEAGHAFLTMHLDMADQIGKLVDKTEGQSRMAQDAQRLMDWFGVKDLDAWKSMTLDEQRDSHEKFARGFEQYLLDGKAPGVRLQRIFQDFRAWLLHLYRSAAGLNVDVSNDIRGVMDRMLASESDIRDAESVRGMKPLFDVKPDGMSDEEFANYQRLGNNASADALDSLESRSLRDMQWRTNAKGRELKRLQKEAEGKREEVRKEVTEEVMSEPVEQARRFIQRGELDSGDRTNAQRRIIEDASMSSTKLSLDDLKLMYGEGPAAPWRYLKSAGKYAEVTTKGGLHPDLVAELFGYGSGDAMVRDLLHKETAEQKIEALTDVRMLERHGNLASPDALERSAEAAIHNAARAKFIAAEMAALSKATGSARALALAAKEAADAAISAKRVKDVTPGQYTVAEARSSRAADSAFKKGDISEAARLKRAQILNNQLARSALKAQEDIAKSLAYFKRFDKDSIRSKMEPADRDVIDGLLERFDFRKNPPDGPTRKQVQLSEWIESQRALGYSPVVDPSIADPSVRAHYTEMTVEQMRGLTATVKAVEHLARERKTVSIEGQKIDLHDAIVPMVEKMKARGEKFTDAQLAERPRYGVDPLWTVTLDRLQSFLRAGFAEFLRTDYKANRYDLHELLGPFQRAISEPLIGASYEYGDRMDAIARIKKQRVEEYGLDREWQDTLHTVVEGHNLADNSIPGHTKRRLTRMDLLGIAMHVGNESNFAKLVDGMKWEPSEIWRALHDNMTEKDWNAVRTMGELSGQGWEDSVAMNRRLGNDQPEKVEPRPFMTKFGEMPGWYAPIGYDPIRSKLGTRKAEELAMNPADGLFGRSYYRSDTTTNGSLNERTGYKDFIDLDFSHIEKRIADTQRDLAYRERLIDAHKIITNPEFAQQFKRTYGPEEHKSLINWLGRLVNAEVGDERQSKLTAIMATTRRAMVANGVALRISTMLKHGGSAGAKSSGYFAGGGGGFFAARAAKMATNYSAEVEEALAKFPEIRQRYRQQDRDLGRAQTNIMDPESIHGKAERFGHAGVAWLDFLTAVPTANAAYDWAITKGIPKRLGGDGKPMSHADAVKFASKMVREAHGSTAEASQSMLVTNKSEIVKTLTTLHGFMNNAFGQNADTFDKLLHANGYGTPELFARAFAAQIVPGIAAGWVSFGGPNEDESYLMWAFHHIAGEFAGMIPLVRDAFSAAEGRRDAGQVPLFRAISDSYKVAKDVSHPSEAKQPIKNFGNVAGLVLPGLGQVGSTTQFLYDEATGAQQAETVGEWARGVMSGKAKHH